MSVCIAGAGWVTPLGASIPDVWDRLLAGETPSVDEVRDPLGERPYSAFRVPQTALKHLPPHPRLRRASAISRFAAAAGMSALTDAKVTPADMLSARSALVFAVANGGVIYTKRFYGDIVSTGAEAASPLLFPETVFNAAASHLAAIIGLGGTTYTVVADGTVGLVGIKMACDLMADPSLDYCLVVAAEEADWLLCDAYAKWRLLKSKPPLELFTEKPRGTILSEGAGALLLSRNGTTEVADISAGSHFGHQRDAAAALTDALEAVNAPRDGIVISSANGTFIDGAELTAFQKVSAYGALYAPKIALGEGVAAGSLWQVIVAMQVLRTNKIPEPAYANGLRQEKSGTPMAIGACTSVTVLSCGLNQQVGAVRLSAPA